MQIFYAKGVLRRMRRVHQAKKPLEGLEKMVHDAEWETPHDALESRGGVDILTDGNLCFNILGNRFRLLAHVNYELQTFTVLFFGTHDEYERYIDREPFR